MVRNFRFRDEKSGLYLEHPLAVGLTLCSWQYKYMVYKFDLVLLSGSFFFFFFMIFKPQLSSWLITGFLTFRFGHFKGSYFRVVSCFLLPAIQLVVGISHPSWVSLPFFICSCVGLVDWSLTSNFSGLFRYCCGSSSHYQFYYLDGLFFFFF